MDWLTLIEIPPPILQALKNQRTEFKETKQLKTRKESLKRRQLRENSDQISVRPPELCAAKTTTVVSQPGAIWPPKGHLAISGDILGCHNWRRKALLALRKWRPGMLLGTLPCIGQYPQQSSGPQCQQCWGWWNLTLKEVKRFQLLPTTGETGAWSLSSDKVYCFKTKQKN